MDMFGSEEKKEEKETASKQSTEKDVISDIEEVLNFLDSEKYQEVRQPVPSTGPSTIEIAPVQSPRKKGPTPERTHPKTVSGPRKVEKEPIKKRLMPSNRTTGKKKSGKIWFLCFGATILIFFAVLILYKMAYPFTVT